MLLLKVFVANPKKPREVTKILVNNKAKLIAYLENFHNDRVSERTVPRGVTGSLESWDP